MPASAMAIRTARAVSSIWAARPSSSGRKARVCEMPTARRFAPPFPVAALRRVNTEACGLSTPSVPPDITMATRASTSSGSQPRLGARAWAKARQAYSRVKSLTPPLPSVLPRMATMSRASSVPARSSFVRPDTSPGPRIGIRCSSTRRALAGLTPLPRFARTRRAARSSRSAGTRRSPRAQRRRWPRTAYRSPGARRRS